MWFGGLGLSDEQQFAVLGQRPEAVIDDEFKLVNLIANLVEHWSDGVVIGDGFLVLVSNLIGDLASLDEFLYQRLDGGRALCDLIDELEVAGTELFGFLGLEDITHPLDVA